MGGAAAGSGNGGGATSGGALIRNDVFWKDSAGSLIYSQGGGVLQVGSTYYWYGVRYAGAATYAATAADEGHALVALVTASSGSTTAAALSAAAKGVSAGTGTTTTTSTLGPKNTVAA